MNLKQDQECQDVKGRLVQNLDGVRKSPAKERHSDIERLVIAQSDRHLADPLFANHSRKVIAHTETDSIENFSQLLLRELLILVKRERRVLLGLL
ncbi:hypothetical protein ASG96_18325 [Terrabacter sp. Soil810]|nr:hypothetical protein ASG96_18325 [Terrabacter sp. Soil810]